MRDSAREARGCEPPGPRVPCARTFRAITSGRLYSAKRHLFGRRRWWLRRSYENLWPFANAWSATTTLSSLGQDAETESILRSLFEGLAAYHRSHASASSSSGQISFESAVAPPLGRGGDVYFDDSAWLGLALVHHHDLHADDTSLSRASSLARRLFGFVTSGWSDESSWSCPGRIRWKLPASNTSRNTCSNAPVAELAALVHERTADPAACGTAPATTEPVCS